MLLQWLYDCGLQTVHVKHFKSCYWKKRIGHAAANKISTQAANRGTTIHKLVEHYLNNENQKINIVVATSGDTGAAAIDAIKGKKNINIVVLHPHNRVSSVQRKLMTTGKEQNVFNIAINGNFDDCQNLVKSMFADKSFSNEIKMSGVNSINWARIIAQSVYYFYSYFLIEDKSVPINFSVPTGNFGDVYAGYLAKKIGLPINKFIVATNQNDILFQE